MTVKEIIKNTALIYGREDVVNYLNGSTIKGEDTLPTVNILVGLLNLVVSELAGTFIPMIKQETVTVTDGKIYYKDLSERIVRILNVYSVNGGETDYGTSVEFIRVKENSVIIEYEYVPPRYGLEDEIGYTEKDVTAAALSYGLCAEYAISLSDFDQAVAWHNRYVDAISNLRKVKNVKIKGRAFV